MSTPLFNKYGTSVLSPTSKVSDDLLPPLSINIFLFVGVTINVLSPCPTSIKWIFKVPGIIFNTLKTKITINKIAIIFLLFFFI